MTRLQFRRMKVFAMRMVAVSTSPRWQPELRELVSRFLDRIDGNKDWPHMKDWDHSERYDEVLSHTWAGGKTTSWRNKGTHPYLCDEVKRFIWDMEDEGILPRTPEDSSRESALAIKLSCCIRAACDVAVAPSAGVLGWTVGDLRKMWANRKLPAWVTRFFEEDVTRASDQEPVWL